MTTPRLEAHGVGKTFRAATVLRDASLVVRPGEIHALVGQNGCGKSTLIKILTGYHSPDPGMSLAVDGQPLGLPVQWQAARAAGVSVVHQDLGLLDDLSVSENIGIGGFVRGRLTRRIDWSAQDAVARRVLDRLELPVAPRDQVGSLSPSHRAGVAIARALRDTVAGRGVMILDEATRALPRDELARFHALVRRVVTTGTSVVMISHNLEEVLSLSDRVSVLRDGLVVAEGRDTASLDEPSLARLMLGTSVDRVVRSRPMSADAPVVATIAALELPGHEPLTLDVRRGEVVGLTGLPGTGFEDVPFLISGARRPPGGGAVVIGNRRVDLRRSSVAALMQVGVAMVPERRVRDGLATELSVRDNLALPSVRRRGRPWFVARAWQQRLAAESIARLTIRTRSSVDLVKELSGGNQQKVLFAKWLSVDPVLLVLHEPTQAVDVGARADLLTAVHRAAEDGMGVLLVSTEPADLVEACDRVLVLHPGRPPLELRTDDAEEVLGAVYALPVPAHTGAPDA
ncbi:sugar ABC transporter ATP-binding protein [soil metagenome]